MEIDIRIITVPEAQRLQNVKVLQEQLNIPDTKVFCDFNYKGCRYNSKRAFTYPSDKSHILVLADDSIVCDNFLRTINKIINKHPDKIIILFDYYGIKEFSNTPYINIKNRQFTGQAIIIPKDYIENIFNFTYNQLYNDKSDDAHIMMAVRYYQYPTMLITPNIVQALPLQSANGGDGTIYSKTFRKDVSDVNWDSDEVEEVYCC